jgi:hypothetical protein
MIYIPQLAITEMYPRIPLGSAQHYGNRCFILHHAVRTVVFLEGDHHLICRQSVSLSTCLCDNKATKTPFATVLLPRQETTLKTQQTSSCNHDSLLTYTKHSSSLYLKTYKSNRNPINTPDISRSYVTQHESRIMLHAGYGFRSPVVP